MEANNQENFISQDEIDEIIDLDGDGDAPDDNDDHDELEDDHMVEDVVDDAVSKFTEHSSVVLCCDVSHDDLLVVTGGQDDKAFVWEASTGQVKFEAAGHKDSVVAVKFNKNATMVATGDLSGIILVWNTEGSRVAEFEVDDLNWLLWHSALDNVLLAGTATGEAWMWKLTKTEPQCKTFQSFGYPNICAKLFNDGKRIVMGYDDGAIRIWDLKETQVLGSITDYQAHKSSVISLNLNADNSLIATGSTDSTVKVINTNNYKVLMTLSCGFTKSENGGNDEEVDGSDSIESVVFGSNNLLAVGTVNGAIEVWHIPTQTKRNEIKLDFGVSKLMVDCINPNKLYAGCLDSFLRVIDLRSCEVILTRSGHRDQILDFSISSDSKYALTCSEDSTCRIYQLVEDQ